MLSFWVIEKLDIIKHILPRIFAGCVRLSSDALSFQELKKALGNGIEAPIFVNQLFGLFQGNKYVDKFRVQYSVSGNE